MGSVSGIDDFAFPPGQAFRFGSLNFITNDFGKMSLLDSDSNQSGRDQPRHLPLEDLGELRLRPRSNLDPGRLALYSNLLGQSRRKSWMATSAPPASVLDQPRSSTTTTSATTMTMATSTTSTTAMRITTRLSSSAYSWLTTKRRNSAEPEKRTKSAHGKKLNVADWRKSDNDRSKNDYSVSNKIANGLQRRLNIDGSAPWNLGDKRESSLGNKTMIAASVPANSASARTPTGSRVPHLRSQDYHQPSLSIAGAGSSRRSRRHDERERRVERPHSPHRRRPINLRDTINQRRAARGHHSPDRYDDDVDGVAAFTSDLRRVDWPAGFKPTGIEKYDGTTNPESWLTVYGLAIRAAGGDSKAMVNYLPVALADSARSWLHGLPRGTIGSWTELRDHFIANFQGTFERPGTHFDLYNIIQKSGESLRDYIRHFSKERNKISDITDDVIIAAFTKGIRHEDLVGKFGRKPPKTVKQMFEKANEYAKAEDAITASKQSGTTWKPKKDTPTAGGSGSNNHKDRKRKPEELVATTSPSSRQRSRVNTFDKIMNSQCPHHPNSNHVAKDCFIYKQFAEQYVKNARKSLDGDQGTSNKKDGEDDVPTGFQDHRKELNHIFGGPLSYESKRKHKLTEREINAVQPNTPVTP
uniref:Retrotransposon protein, putative, Ty3-gypsy subclass n=1 Tax=Oryza sativa subsp. japonica TaxID=39947 RepID=Q2QRP7_ORYSJ|nr:retrotransposon protein, putative, Ty3-gypsy subclass [Oryza sativa Japonica Group]